MLKDLKDEIVLINFWSKEEKICFNALHFIKNMQKKFGNNMVVIGIHEYTEDIDNLKSLIISKGLTYHLAIDSKSKKQDSRGVTFDAYRFVRYPMTVLIDKNGIVHMDGVYLNKKDKTFIEDMFVIIHHDIESKIRRLHTITNTHLQ